MNGKYFSLFSHNPFQLELLEIAKEEQIGDSLAFVDALVRVSKSPAVDTEALILQKFETWRVINQSSQWQRIDRF